MKVVKDYIRYITEEDPLAVKAVGDLLALDPEKGLLVLDELDKRNLRGIRLASLYVECGEDVGVLCERVSRPV